MVMTQAWPDEFATGKCSLCISEICDMSPPSGIGCSISPFSFATSKKREDDIVFFHMRHEIRNFFVRLQKKDEKDL